VRIKGVHRGGRLITLEEAKAHRLIDWLCVQVYGVAAVTREQWSENGRGGGVACVLVFV
jgi:hypothetical protein